MKIVWINVDKVLFKLKTSFKIVLKSVKLNKEKLLSKFMISFITKIFLKNQNIQKSNENENIIYF
jgi:hypothetical protein